MCVSPGLTQSQKLPQIALKHRERTSVIDRGPARSSHLLGPCLSVLDLTPASLDSPGGEGLGGLTDGLQYRKPRSPPQEFAPGLIGPGKDFMVCVLASSSLLFMCVMGVHSPSSLFPLPWEAPTPSASMHSCPVIAPMLYCAEKGGVNRPCSSHSHAQSSYAAVQLPKEPRSDGRP